MFWVTGPLTLLIVVAQIAVVPALRYAGVHPDLLVIWLSCYAAARSAPTDALPLVAVGGLGLGLCGAEPLGTSLFALLPLAALIATQEIWPVRRRLIVALVLAAVGGLFYSMLQPLGAALAGQGLGPLLNLLRVAPRAAILDTAGALIWYWPVRFAFAVRPTLGSFRRL
jgi:hypothetical protein